MAQMIRILGIDPGLRHTGWGVITLDGPRLGWIAHGVINPDPHADMADRLAILCAGLRDLGFKFVRPSGTYFTVADYSHMSDLTDVEFSHWLTEHKKVAVIPTSVFYNDPVSAAKKQKLVRFAFCKDIETLKCGLKNLSLN